eukprot:1374557-Pleurochrysis_carterae.AAC.1
MPPRAVGSCAWVRARACVGARVETGDAHEPAVDAKALDASLSEPRSDALARSACESRAKRSDSKSHSEGKSAATQEQLVALLTLGKSVDSS